MYIINNEKQIIMKNLILNHWSISLRTSNHILRIQEMKKQINNDFDTTNILYKKTIKEISKLGGKSVIVKDNYIFKMLVTQNTYKGRTYERVNLFPIYNLKTL